MSILIAKDIQGNPGKFDYVQEWNDLIISVILIERNIYPDRHSGLIMVKIDKGIESGILSAYSYLNSSLTLYFGPFQ